MDSLQDILGKKNFTPPDEVTALKDYVWRKYKRKVGVKIEKNAVILSVPGSGLAATLQMEKPQIIDACGLKTDLIIRTVYR